MTGDEEAFACHAERKVLLPMLTLHVRLGPIRTASTAPRATIQGSLAPTHASAVLDAAIHLLATRPVLSEADIARGYPLVICIHPRRAMH